MRTMDVHSIEPIRLTAPRGKRIGVDDLVDHRLGHGDRHNTDFDTRYRRRGPRRRPIAGHGVVTTVPNLLEHFHAMWAYAFHQFAIAGFKAWVPQIKRECRGGMHRSNLQNRAASASTGTCFVIRNEIITDSAFPKNG